MATGSKAAAKAAAKAKSAAKALAGYPGIFHHLAGEHAEVNVIMKRIEASSASGNTRAELFQELRRNLLAHAHGEEETFYPPLRRFLELEPLVSQSLEQHTAIERLLGELDRADKSTQRWLDQFRQLMEQVKQHVHLEESELFPQAKDLLGREEARDMEHRYEQAEEREKSRLH